MAASMTSLSSTSPANSSASLMSAVDRRASHAFRLSAELLKNLIEARNLIFGLLEMVAQALGQIAVCRLVDQLGERFNDLVLGVVDVLQAVQKQVVHRFDVFAEEAHNCIPWEMISQQTADAAGGSVG